MSTTITPPANTSFPLQTPGYPLASVPASNPIATSGTGPGAITGGSQMSNATDGTNLYLVLDSSTNFVSGTSNTENRVI
jgi:hypothetical protein